MAHKISILNWKGGVGKTTFSHHIGTGLQEINWNGKRLPRILLIDLDPQCNLSISCLGDDVFEDLVHKNNQPTMKSLLNEFSMNDNPNINLDNFILQDSVRKNFCRNNSLTTYKNIDLILSHQDLIYTDMHIASFNRPGFHPRLFTHGINQDINQNIYKFKFLYNFINMIEDLYDYIVIDCPPNLNFITQNALYASDYYLIPTILDKLSTYGILSITEKIKELNSTFSSSGNNNYVDTKLAGIVANKVATRNGVPIASQHNFYKRLEKTFGDILFKNFLTSGEGIAEASARGLPVYAISGNTALKQSQSFKDVIHELQQHIDNVLLQELTEELLQDMNF